MNEKQKGGEKTAWWRKKWVLMLGAALAVALILLGNDSVASDRTATHEATKDQKDALYEYGEMIERKVVLLCSAVRGVSEVQVAVSLEGDFTYVYATDSDTRQSDGTVESNLEYVTVGSGSSEQTVLLTRSFPKVSGIGIVCRGGGDAAVRQELLSLLGAAFGVSTNKIYIAEANP